MYGANLLNIIQGLARDGNILANLDRAGFQIVLHVHDEVVVEADEAYLMKLSQPKLLSQPPEWMKEVPLHLKRLYQRSTRNDCRINW